MNDVPWLKPEQVEQMRDAAYDGQNGLRDETIITLLYDTGLRRMELSQLDRDMVDLDEEVLRLPAEIQKDYPNESSPNRVVLELDRGDNVDLHTTRLLKRYIDEIDNGPLFPSRQRSRLSPKSINLVVKRCAKRSRIRPYRFSGRGEPAEVSSHTLRHSVAWRLLRAESNFTIYNVKNRLRHSSVQTTEKKYAHFDKV